VDVSSAALVELARERGALYLDTCIEPWAGGYVDAERFGRVAEQLHHAPGRLEAAQSSEGCTTAVLTHGANPGLVSHLVKQALMNIAKDTSVDAGEPASRADWAKLGAAAGHQGHSYRRARHPGGQHTGRNRTSS